MLPTEEQKKYTEYLHLLFSFSLTCKYLIQVNGSQKSLCKENQIYLCL